jgi:hypothetical protein
VSAKQLLTYFVLIIIGHTAQAQLNVPMNFGYVHELNRSLEHRNSGFHTAIKPYARMEVDSIIVQDSIYSFKQHKGYLNNLANGDFISVKKNKFSLGINPLFNVMYGVDLQTKASVYETDFGGQLNATIANKIGIGFTYRKYIGDPVLYAKSRIVGTKIIPGYHLVDDLESTKNLRSEAFEGYINISPNKHFSVEGGYGKHFWGDGYRSFFLSDNAASYPYVKLTANFWRIKYVYLFSVLKYGELGPKLEFDVSDLKKKYSVFHYLSIDAAKWFQFGFFEGVVWKREDIDGTRGIEWNYLNPVVFIRPIEFAIGSPDNVILGFNFKFKIGNQNQIYTQLILDDLDIGSIRKGSGFYRTKVAWQMGYKTFNLFKIDHLDFQTEFNMARPYVFAHKTPEQNYAQLTQSLTHPLGANFWEWLVFVKYRNGRWQAALDFQWAKQGGDDPTNPYANHQGSNIFVSDFDIDNIVGDDLDSAFGNEFLQGQLNDITSIKVSGGYLLNPTLNMQLELFVHHRVRNIPALDFSEKNTVVGVAFKTNLFNKYYDF